MTIGHGENWRYMSNFLGLDLSRSNIAGCSRLERQGFEPLKTAKGKPAHMAAPKDDWIGAKRLEYLPLLPEAHLSWLAGELGPAERRAMRQIVQAGDMYEIDGTHYLVSPVTPETLEALAVFEVEGEDRELDPDEESVETDGGYDDQEATGAGFTNPDPWGHNNTPSEQPLEVRLPVVDGDGKPTGEVIEIGGVS